jgi:hypothetical protein
MDRNTDPATTMSSRAARLHLGAITSRRVQDVGGSTLEPGVICRDSGRVLRQHCRWLVSRSPARRTPAITVIYDHRWRQSNATAPVTPRRQSQHDAADESSNSSARTKSEESAFFATNSPHTSTSLLSTSCAWPVRHAGRSHPVACGMCM